MSRKLLKEELTVVRLCVEMYNNVLPEGMKIKTFTELGTFNNDDVALHYENGLIVKQNYDNIKRYVATH